MSDEKEVNYEKFPAILKKKLEAGVISFPPETKFTYNSMIAYRAVARNIDDFSPVSRKDFKSYAEEGRKRTRKQLIDENNATYYGTSLFLERGIVENIMKFPNPNKKIACGSVSQEKGPCLVNEETKHVCWWLFDNVCLDDFKIV